MNTAALKSVYLRTGLWRLGKTFDQCLASQTLRLQMQRHAAAIHTLARRRNQPLPQQLEMHL